MKIRCIIYFLIAFTSCSSQEKLAQDVNGYDAKVAENGESIHFSDVKFIKLQKTQSSQLYSPGKVVQTSRYTLIQDKDRVQCFDNQGTFLRSIGRRGHGHGEYVNLATFYVESDDVVVVVDSYKGSLLRYGMDGTLKEEVKIGKALVNVQNGVLLNKDSLFVSNYIMNDQRGVYGILDLKNRQMSTTVDALMSTDNVMMPVGHQPFSLHRGNLKYVLPFDERVYDLRGECYRYVTSMPMLSDQELKKIKNFSLSSYAEPLKSNAFVGFTDIYETDHYLFTAFTDWEYTLLDKRTNQCHRYSYKLKENLGSMPIVKIVAARGNCLIGLFNTNDLKAIKEYNRRDANLVKLMSFAGEKDTYVLVEYGLKTI